MPARELPETVWLWYMKDHGPGGAPTRLWRVCSGSACGYRLYMGFTDSPDLPGESTRLGLRSRLLCETWLFMNGYEPAPGVITFDRPAKFYLQRPNPPPDPPPPPNDEPPEPRSTRGR